ncbi:MAG: alpha-amylase family glycosyl hydrolase [Anaerolineales bacterium]
MGLKNTVRFCLFIACLITLSACVGAKAKLIQPITGLPQGTDGYAWWNDTVFYEIFVRSFYDSDGNGIGDFNGIVDKLDYLNDGDPKTTTDLGITGLWLMPINPAESYHGYDPTDYYAVNSDYGTMDDFNRLLQECHKRGIRVIIDMVYNHTSNKHPWFIESRDQPQSAKHDWYIWSSTNPGYQGPWGEQVWYPTVSGYYYAIFWIGQPDLDYINQAVSDEMYNVAKYWLQDIGVDGFRLDAVRYLIEDGKDQQDTPETLSWWSNFRTFFKGINPQAMTVGEVYTTNYIVENYLKENDFDQAFDFDLASQILKNIDGRNAVNLNASIKSSFQLFAKGEYATFLSNHDQERVMSFFSGDMVKAKLASSVLLTIPGTPFVYYGEEIGMTGNKPDERIRTPMLWSAGRYAGFSTVIPWESTNSNYEQYNVATETNDPNSLLSWYRDLIQLRNNHAALRVGDYYTVRCDNFSIMPFLRVSKEETLLIILNLSEKPASGFSLTLDQGPLKGNYNTYIVLGEGNLKGVKANSQGGFDAYQPLSEVPANGLVIIQLR